MSRLNMRRAIYEAAMLVLWQSTEATSWGAVIAAACAVSVLSKYDLAPGGALGVA